MSSECCLLLSDEIARRVRARVAGRVTELDAVVRADRVTLRGNASSYYAKQLAQQAVRELLPRIHIDNVLVVADSDRVSAA